jgi:hypothetical protein
MTGERCRVVVKKMAKTIETEAWRECVPQKAVIGYSEGWVLPTKIKDDPDFGLADESS